MEVNYLDNNILLWIIYVRNMCFIERKEGIVNDDKKFFCYKIWNKWNYYGIMYKEYNIYIFVEYLECFKNFI